MQFEPKERYSTQLKERYSTRALVDWYCVKMAEKRGVRSKLFGKSPERPEDRRRREREQEEKQRVDKRSMFKKVMGSG